MKPNIYYGNFSVLSLFPSEFMYSVFVFVFVFLFGHMFIECSVRAKHCWGTLGGTPREITDHSCPHAWGQEGQATWWRKVIGIKLAQSTLVKSCIVGDT